MGVQPATNTDTIATVNVAITTLTFAIVTTLEVCYCALDSEIGTLAWISRRKLGTPKSEIQKQLDHFDSYQSPNLNLSEPIAAKATPEHKCIPELSVCGIERNSGDFAI